MQISINDYNVKGESLISIPKFGIAKYKFADLEFIKPVQVDIGYVNQGQTFTETFKAVEIKCYSNTVDIVRESKRVESFNVNDVITIKIKEIENDHS